jgi:transcriptional regulator with XRE-family HTH domain
MAPEQTAQKRLRAIAARIKEVLDSNEMTHRDLAKKAGMRDSVIHRILEGQTNLTLKTIARIEHALGTTIISVP